METLERITRGKIALKHTDWLLLADHTLSAARLIFRVLGPVEMDKLDDVKKAVLFTYVRAFRSAEVCVHLFAEGFAPEAFLPLRTLFEHLVDMKFVVTRPQEATRFWQYMPVGLMRHIRTAEKYFTVSPFTQEFVDAAKLNYEQVKGEYPDEIRWQSTEFRQLPRRADLVGLLEQYEFIYKTCSEYCHTGPLTFPKHFIEEESFFNVSLGPSETDDPTVIALLVPMLLQVAEVINSTHDLGQKQLLEALALDFARLTGTAPTSAPPAA